MTIHNIIHEKWFFKVTRWDHDLINFFDQIFPSSVTCLHTKLLCVYIHWLLFYSEYVQHNMWFINDTWHRLTWSHILSANQFLIRLFSRTLYIRKLILATKLEWLSKKAYLEWSICKFNFRFSFDESFLLTKLKYFWQME